MKVDIPPKPERAPLRIPSWVPPSVGRVARGSYATVIASEQGSDGEDFYFNWGTKLLIPLVCDRRMRRVWDELRKRRSNGAFMHPATSSIGAANADDRQGEAMARLFETAMNCTLAPGVTMTRCQAEQRRDEFLAKAKCLQIDAAMGGLLEVITFGGERDIMTDERCQRLMSAAKAYEEIANQTFAADMRAALERDSGDAGARWFAQTIASRNKNLFGKPLYGLTAIITSVVQGREIGWRTIRQWYSHPADKGP
jgi:hypothetical protein